MRPEHRPGRLGLLHVECAEHPGLTMACNCALINVRACARRELDPTAVLGVHGDVHLARRRAVIGGAGLFQRVGVQRHGAVGDTTNSHVVLNRALRSA
jgi:hypothetical protein